MVGFIDDQKVEVAGKRLFLAVVIGKQPALAGEHQLGIFKWVFAAIGLALLLIEQAYVERKAAQ